MRPILGGTNTELKVKNNFIRVLLWIWQCPQCLIGLCTLLLLRLLGKIVRRDGDIWLVSWLFGAGGVCLGELVLVLETENNILTKKHELGHRCQSRILGPLYLIIVGLPSVCINLAARKSLKVRSTYYQKFPENWADKLGKIQR